MERSGLRKVNSGAYSERKTPAGDLIGITRLPVRRLSPNGRAAMAFEHVVSVRCMSANCYLIIHSSPHLRHFARNHTPPPWFSSDGSPPSGKGAGPEDSTLNLPYA